MGSDSQLGKQTGPCDLISIKLNIGEVLQLHDFSPTKQRYFVKLIGYLNKRSVLVSHPMQDQNLSFVKEGQSFLARGFSGTKTFEFNVNTIAVCLTPYPYLHLSFPEQVKTTNMRGEFRVKTKLVCSVEMQGESIAAQKIPSTIEDLTTSGARVRSKKEFGKLGDAVGVSFRLPIDGDVHLFVIPSIIRNIYIETAIDNSGEDVVVSHGLQFVQVQELDRMALQNFIYKTIADI